MSAQERESSPQTIRGVSDLRLITCVVQRGKADKIVKAAMDAGAGGATVCFGRGMGVRERMGLLGLAIVPEKEIITIVCTQSETDPIMDTIVKVAHLDVPGNGIAYVSPIHHVVGLVAGTSQIE
ncbi:MAG: P-II family nitrogen regulator [Myxococcota bacterium]|jgi:nitrogen regulatory protein PII|nr:P-II family nitrogen regulator [Myxococcota bacterium]